MKPRTVLNTSVTPDGEELELALEHGHHIVRVGGVPLMSSAMRGSEEAMAHIAFEELTKTQNVRVLVGGLGLGFTLRSVLDVFPPTTSICVAELMVQLVDYNRTLLGPRHQEALRDPRVEMFEGDVRTKIGEGGWDAILMDVDNGPDAFSTSSNSGFYSARGTRNMARALKPGGVLVVWSAYPSRPYLHRLRAGGFDARAMTVRARWPLAKGPKHTLFVGRSLR